MKYFALKYLRISWEYFKIFHKTFNFRYYATYNFYNIIKVYEVKLV